MRGRKTALSPAQCRIARVLLEWSQRDLAQKCGVSHVTIGRFETGHELTKPVQLAIRYKLEEAGIEFEGDPGPLSGVARVELEDGTAVTLRRKQPRA